MSTIISGDRLRLLINRLRERLWVKPLAICLLSIASVLAAKVADDTDFAQLMPAISADSIESLLSIIASSMLVIADDVSQNVLSTLIGAFIFSVVALTAVKNDFFETAGLFTLFVLMAAVFAIVILTFLRWVDRIARLGRLGMTIDVVEKTTADAMRRRRDAPTLQCLAKRSQDVCGQAVFADEVGYV